MITFKQYLDEMAKNIGQSYSRLDGQDNRRTYFDHSKDFSIHKEENGIKIHKSVVGNTTNYFSNDHNKKETLHHATFTKNYHKDLPFQHETQTIVNKQKNSLNRGYASDHTYNHFKSSNHPLVSSDEQYKDGHKMWRRLVHKAIEDGHHVYHWDGKTLHKSTHDTLDHHLDSSFGESDDHRHKHMIISKKEL